MTVAAFMELALYDPSAGYYARAAQRSGRAGDFFTSVDVGPAFGQMLAEQFAEMADLLTGKAAVASPSPAPGPRPAPASQPAAPVFDLVEAAAGNGRLSADILDALSSRRADIYARTALHLVERSREAHDAQPATLGRHQSRLASSSAEVPPFEGVLFANELLDAMPVHQVVMRGGSLREVFVAATGRGLTLIEREPSTPALAAHLEDAGAALEEGWRAEINLSAAQWVRHASRSLRRGFLVLFDYGHDARELYSVTHASGTLTSFAKHVAAGAEAALPVWLQRPGEQDITAHVDFSTVQRVAREEGLRTIAFLDQTYFLLGILQKANALPAASHRALKTLLMPGGLGSTMKVLILARGVDVDAAGLIGCSFSTRVT